MLALPTARVQAHGGGTPQLTNADAGPYWVSVWTQPEPLRAGEVHVTVAVSEPGETNTSGREAGAPVLGADVQVEFSRTASSSEKAPGQPIFVYATHESAANKLLYEADLTLPTSGEWQVRVTVEGPAGQGSANFRATVRAEQSSNWTWVLVLGPAAIAAVWIWQRFRVDSIDSDSTDIEEQK
jgi:hypothetical protein